MRMLFSRFINKRSKFSGLVFLLSFTASVNAQAQRKPSVEQLKIAINYLEKLPHFYYTPRFVCFRDNYFVGKYGPISRNDNHIFLVEGSDEVFPDRQEEGEFFDIGKGSHTTVMFGSARLLVTIHLWRGFELTFHPDVWGLTLAPGVIRNRISGSLNRAWCVIEGEDRNFL